MQFSCFFVASLDTIQQFRVFKHRFSNNNKNPTCIFCMLDCGGVVTSYSSKKCTKHRKTVHALMNIKRMVHLTWSICHSKHHHEGWLCGSLSFEGRGSLFSCGHPLLTKLHVLYLIHTFANLF